MYRGVGLVAETVVTIFGDGDGEEVVTIVKSPETIVVAGPPGAPGTAGAPGWYHGHGAPSGDHGWLAGSLYMDVDNGDLYEVGE
jgi:hypothetical protein